MTHMNNPRGRNPAPKLKLATDQSLNRRFFVINAAIKKADKLITSISFETRLVVTAMSALVLIQMGFQVAPTDIGWRCANMAFAYVGARGIFSHMDDLKLQTFILAMVFGLLLSSGGGLLRDVVSIGRDYYGNFSHPADMASVLWGLIVATFIGSSGSTGGGNTPPLSVRFLDVASGITFTALGAGVAYAWLQPVGFETAAVLKIVFCGYLTACGGGLVLNLIRAMLREDNKDGVSTVNDVSNLENNVENLKAYGGTMLVTSILFAGIAILTGGISFFANMVVTAVGTTVFVAAERLLGKVHDAVSIA